MQATQFRRSLPQREAGRSLLSTGSMVDLNVQMRASLDAPTDTRSSLLHASSPSKKSPRLHVEVPSHSPMLAPNGRQLLFSSHFAHDSALASAHSLWPSLDKCHGMPIASSRAALPALSAGAVGAVSPTRVHLSQSRPIASSAFSPSASVFRRAASSALDLR